MYQAVYNELYKGIVVEFIRSLLLMGGVKSLKFSTVKFCDLKEFVWIMQIYLLHSVTAWPILIFFNTHRSLPQSVT